MTSVRDYIIADRRVRIVGVLCDAVMPKLTPFDVFRVEPALLEQPLIEIELGTDVEFQPMTYRLLTKFELEDGLGWCSFFSNADGYALVIEGDTARMVFVCDNSMRVVKTNLSASSESVLIPCVRFGLWFVINMSFVMDGCSAVHSSTIICRDGAVMFLGESGTGKSTHTRLWRENIQGAALLNDDSPFVALRNGEICVYGSPWSGKTPCYKNETYPLRAIVRLSQAPYNAMKKLHKLQAIGALLPSLPPAFVYDKVLEEALLEVLSKVLSQMPVYHLECLPDAAAAELSYKTIFGNENGC